jgi:hypothetical protein
MEGLQKCVQAEWEYVGWTKRTQYIEIDFNCEIHLCYTWRHTPYTIFCDGRSLSKRFTINKFHPARCRELLLT